MKPIRAVGKRRSLNLSSKVLSRAEILPFSALTFFWLAGSDLLLQPMASFDVVLNTARHWGLLSHPRCSWHLGKIGEGGEVTLWLWDTFSHE